jgi:hypothetical protein
VRLPDDRGKHVGPHGGGSAQLVVYPDLHDIGLRVTAKLTSHIRCNGVVPFW